VQVSNGLVIVGSKSIGKTVLARAAASALADGWFRVAAVEWDERHNAGRSLREAMDDQGMRGFAASASTTAGVRDVRRGGVTRRGHRVIMPGLCGNQLMWRWPRAKV
jgi:molybdopterin-guanine dinucleotide biosynthesis protein